MTKPQLKPVNGSKNPAQSRGRPRSAVARKAIHRAFIKTLKSTGFNRLSIDAVAKEAGVSRSTIYRWYPAKIDIALDIAVDIAGESEKALMTGNQEIDLRAFLQRTLATANTLGPLFTALMAEAQADLRFAKKMWDAYASRRRRYLLELLQGLQTNGATQANELLMDLLFGAIWYRLMSGHAPLNDAFVEELMDVVRRLRG